MDVVNKIITVAVNQIYVDTERICDDIDGIYVNMYGLDLYDDKNESVSSTKDRIKNLNMYSLDLYDDKKKYLINKKYE